MQVDLQFNVRTLIIEINYTLLLLFYIKTLFHSKLFCLLFYIYACLGITIWLQFIHYCFTL